MIRPPMPRIALVTLAVLAVAGCRQDMHDQPRYEPYAASTTFDDGTSARFPVEGTIARGQLAADTHLQTGMVDGQPAATYPFPVTEEVLARGRQRYDIFCSPCHGLTGYGDGMVVRRGFKVPPALHSERHRTSPPGYYFDVMTRGFGQMPSYAEQVPVHDRWAIVAYLRALQHSQHAPLDEIPATERAALLRAKDAVVSEGVRLAETPSAEAEE